MKRNYWAEAALLAASIVATWYISEEHPEPLPAFYFYTGKYARTIAVWADRHYFDTIRKLYG